MSKIYPIASWGELSISALIVLLFTAFVSLGVWLHEKSREKHELLFKASDFYIYFPIIILLFGVISLSFTDYRNSQFQKALEVSLNVESVDLSEGSFSDSRCSDDFSSSLQGARWRDSEDDFKIGMLLGSKNDDGTCSYRLTAIDSPVKETY
jgi:hypothetical protein